MQDKIAIVDAVYTQIPEDKTATNDRISKATASLEQKLEAAIEQEAELEGEVKACVN